MKRLSYRLLIVYSIMHTPVALTTSTTYGVCCVPVADLTVKPLAADPYTTAYTHGARLQVGNYKKHTIARISQLLLNDQVIVAQTTDTEYKIQTIDQAYANATHTYNTTYYVDKQAIALTTQAPLKKAEKVFLIRPYFVPELGTTLSAGTGFAVVNTTANQYIVTSVHPETLKNTTCTLSKQVCCKPYKNSQKKRTAFVQLVRFWAQQAPDKIPYVLGGSSILQTAPPTDFTLHSFGLSHFSIKAYHRTALTYPYTGLDCAHLVFLAARMTGVAITTTNTLGQNKECKLFTKNDTLEAGDLVFWKGHVIVITDPQAGLLAEARGYGAGYGIVHEIPLQEQFQGIRTGNDLVTAFFNKTPITRLNKQQEVEQIITDLRIYKLPV